MGHQEVLAAPARDGPRLTIAFERHALAVLILVLALLVLHFAGKLLEPESSALDIVAVAFGIAAVVAGGLVILLRR